MALFCLVKNEKNKFICPHCGRQLYCLEGGTVKIIDGKADMSAVLPKYVCEHCGLYYQELLGSGFYDECNDFSKIKASLQAAKPKLVSTGDLQPMQLKKDIKGQSVCPRCGDMMDYVEGRPVQIVDGKPDMENVKDHFYCSHCKSMFRRIANTDYFQWTEK